MSDESDKTDDVPVNNHADKTPAKPGEFNPLDVSRLRLSQDSSQSFGVKKLLTVVKVRKPEKQEFCRVRKGEDWRLATAVLEERATKENYLVAPELYGEVAEFIQPVLLLTAINKQGGVFLWRCKLPTADGRPNAWTDSMLAAARVAETAWVRVQANMEGNLYDVFEASGALAEPEWPADVTFQALIDLAFKQRYIDTFDHPVLKLLRGEA